MAHAGLIWVMVAKNESHANVPAPPEHALCASWRSWAVHAFFVTGSTGVVTLSGQLGYGAGQVDCWLLQTRGFTLVLQTLFCAVQSTQLLPFDPQRLLVNPAKQVPAWQQPDGQFCGVHVGWTTHVPFEQVPLDSVQFWQALPWMPQVVFVDGRQLLPWQHPFGHVCGVQVGGGPSQAPVVVLQVCPFPAQSVQRRPPLPQAFPSVPPRHTSPEQHPLQFWGPHFGGAHFFTEMSHTVPDWLQSAHLMPPLPHATDELPLTHTP